LEAAAKAAQCESGAHPPQWSDPNDIQRKRRDHGADLFNFSTGTY
jgi:hypothetical protein